ncbi:hypothetical protein VKT23_013684 [Stygiomarasmius scandens]|uniref:Serine protease inhibitor n=1 Tax=Marasmiellus scandens TaxID=2682957 RepID=A0ABR1J513_9AGAR
MPLESGTYTIRSCEFNIGRPLAEDRSLLPKRIVVLPEEQTSVWEIEKISTDTYFLKNQNSPTGNIDNKVAALLIMQEDAVKWRIEAIPQHGHNRYIIITEDRSKGWVASDEPFEQVKCQPLIVGPSVPPFYPQTEIFEIVRASME